MSFLIELDEVLSKIWTRENIHLLFEQIEQNLKVSAKNEVTVAKLFEFANKSPLLKVIESIIPVGILPVGYEGSIYDVRVAARGPDDKIYRENKIIRENIPRGMTFLRMNDSLDLVIYANKKFTGGVGDEDDDQPENDDEWKNFFLQSIEKTERIVSMMKLNGEAGHFSGRFIGGKFYIVCGSKNVHMLIGASEDIELYTDSRYFVARHVAQSVWKNFQRLEGNILRVFKQFLSETKFTCICELQQPDYQHIVDLSYLKEPELGFLMVTSTAYAPQIDTQTEEMPNCSVDDDSLTAINPDLAIDLFKALGFYTPKIEIFSLSQFEAHFGIVRSSYNLEGSVFYFLTKENKTIGLSKVKTVWYILLRALREKAAYSFSPGKNRPPLTIEAMIRSKSKRFREIQQWIKFDDKFFTKWQELSDNYLKWLSIKIQDGSILTTSLRPQFPIIWSKFLYETKSSDEIEFSKR